MRERAPVQEGFGLHGARELGWPSRPIGAVSGAAAASPPACEAVNFSSARAGGVCESKICGSKICARVQVRFILHAARSLGRLRRLFGAVSGAAAVSPPACEAVTLSSARAGGVCESKICGSKICARVQVRFILHAARSHGRLRRLFGAVSGAAAVGSTPCKAVQARSSCKSGVCKGKICARRSALSCTLQVCWLVATRRPRLASGPIRERFDAALSSL